MKIIVSVKSLAFFIYKNLNEMPWPLEWHRFAKLKLVVRVHPVSLAVVLYRK